MKIFYQFCSSSFVFFKDDFQNFGTYLGYSTLGNIQHIAYLFRLKAQTEKYAHIKIFFAEFILL